MSVSFGGAVSGVPRAIGVWKGAAAGVGDRDAPVWASCRSLRVAGP